MACLLVSAGSHACAYWQTDCDDEDWSSPPPSWSSPSPSTPPQRVDRVVVTAPNPPPPPPPFVWVSPAPYVPPAPSPSAVPTGSSKDFFEAAIRTARALCKKRSETCQDWGQRMVSGTRDKSSFCDKQIVSVQALCNLAVNEEVQLNSCVNTVPCP